MHELQRTDPDTRISTEPRISPRILVTALVALSLLAAACGSDDGASVREVDGGSDSGSASASGSAPADGSVNESGGTATLDGGYLYASDVSSHRLVVVDICTINQLLDEDPIDFDAVETIYRDGEASQKSDGTVRSIGGFAAADDKNHGLDQYYGTPTPLDDFVTAALDGTGMFEGESDAVRRQGVQKGIQNQVMVAWTTHELNSALAKAGEANFDVPEGAPHNWDEAWAFFHGAQPACAPYATSDKRAADFATTGADGETAPANEAILGAMTTGRDALLAGDSETAAVAADEVLRNIVITYSQAAIRYATVIEDDLAGDDADSARTHQAEGLAFWRVIEAIVAAEGADVDAVNAVYDLANEPGANGFGGVVIEALQPAWDSLGISADDIGELR